MIGIREWDRCTIGGVKIPVLQSDGGAARAYREAIAKPIVLTLHTPGGPVADLKQALASLTGPGAYCVLPDGYRVEFIAPRPSPSALAAARRKPGPALALGVGGRRGRRRRRAEERRKVAVYLAWELPRVYVTGGNRAERRAMTAMLGSDPLDGRDVNVIPATLAEVEAADAERRRVR